MLRKLIFVSKDDMQIAKLVTKFFLNIILTNEEDITEYNSWISSRISIPNNLSPMDVLQT